MITQRTLKNVIKAKGVGLHSGEQVFVTLKPAPVDAGIVFTRTDLHPAVSIDAVAANVGDAGVATTLAADGVRISTIEHVMSAFCGLGIDNAEVELSAAEVPIMDGSAAPFVFLIQSAGHAEQGAPKRFLRVLKEIQYRDGDVVAALAPHDGFRIEYSLEYNHPVFQRHTRTASLDFSMTSYISEVSRARTFGFLAEPNDVRSMNLAPASSLDESREADDPRILNDSALRLEDEFVKHKILDVVGDLYLLGHSLIGRFSGRESGHASNNALLGELLADPEAFEVVTFEEHQTTAPVSYSPPLYG